MRRFPEELSRWSKEEFAKHGLTLAEPRAVVEADFSKLVSSVSAHLTLFPGPFGSFIKIVAENKFSISGYVPFTVGGGVHESKGRLFYQSLADLLKTTHLTAKIGNRSITVILLDTESNVTGVFSGPWSLWPLTIAAGFAHGAEV